MPPNHLVSTPEVNPQPPVPEQGNALASAPRGRASWSGLLRLSLVAVPVKAYAATTSGPEVRFNQLHANCGQRIRYEKRCPVHGKVDAAAIVSGYPVAPDQYVVVDESELEKLRPAQDRALTLERFLESGQVDPAFFSGRSLYLLPDGPAAHHPYQILVQAMRERGKWAIARVVLSGRRQLTLVRPANRILTLHVLYYPTQVRACTALEAELRPGPLGEAEEKLAGMLIDASSQAIRWSEYRDDSADKLKTLVEASLEGRVVTAPAPEEVPVLQLLDALKQSVEKAVKTSPPATTTVTGARKVRSRTPRRSA